MPKDKYKNTHNSYKTRLGDTASRPCVRWENRNITMPTDKQMQYIETLISALEKNGIDHTRITKYGTYKRNYREAGACIYRLLGLLKSENIDSDVGIRYIVLCKNPETGERREFSAKKMYQKPKGWEWIGLVRKEVVGLEE